MQVTVCRLHVAYWKLQIAGCRLQVAGCMLQAAGYTLHGASCMLQAAGCRLQDAGCRLKVEVLFKDLSISSVQYPNSIKTFFKGKCNTSILFIIHQLLWTADGVIFCCPLHFFKFDNLTPILIFFSKGGGHKNWPFFTLSNTINWRVFNALFL